MYTQTTLFNDLHLSTSSLAQRSRRQRTLQDALAPYVDLKLLRTLAAAGETDGLRAALHTNESPQEVLDLLEVLADLLRPTRRERISSPSDVAALLMAEMGHLDHEQLRTVLLDTKNRVQAVHTVYVGMVDQTPVRVCEVFKEAIRRNCASLILVHNHPTGDPSPSSQDVNATREIVQAGALLGIDVLDHLIIGTGDWISMREKGLGFAK